MATPEPVRLSAVATVAHPDTQRRREEVHPARAGETVIISSLLRRCVVAVIFGIVTGVTIYWMARIPL